MIGVLTHIHTISIRPLAKLKIQFKIANTSNKIESESEALSTIPIAVRKDFESLDKTDGMFVGHPLT